jgi:Tol biopolymer transport system component
MVDRVARVALMAFVGWLAGISTLPGRASPGPGALIAFTRCRELTGCERGSDIWVMRPDATGLKVLTRDGTHNSSPSWSPDGRRIAFVSGRGGFDQIWTMKADGSSLRRLTAPRALDADPAWSPDGRRIAFVRRLSALHSAIYLIDVDGTHLRVLTPGRGDYRHPSWSPDGHRIVYSHSADPRRLRYAISVVGINGRGVRRLSARGGGDYLDPSWSLDGGRIAFSYLVPTGGTYTAHIETVSADGGKMRMIARAPAGTVYFGPSWSPTGRQITFVSLSNRKKLAEIGIVNSDGSHLRVLTQLLGDSRSPAWRAVRRT